MEKEQTLLEQGVLLSREELLYCLNALGAELPATIAGKETLSDAQKQVMFQYAERALRARELLVRAGDGQVLMDADLQAMAQACAFPERMVIATQFPAAGSGRIPSRLYIYQHAGQAVLHLAPQPGLHHLRAFEAGPQTTAAVLSVLGCQDLPGGTFPPCALPSDVLQRVTQAASAGQAEQAAAALRAQAIDPASAQALLQILSGPYDLILLEYAVRLQNQQVASNQVTVIKSAAAPKSAASLSAVPVKSAPVPTQKLQPVETGQLEDLLLGWLKK